MQIIKIWQQNVAPQWEILGGCIEFKSHDTFFINKTILSETQCNVDLCI